MEGGNGKPLWARRSLPPAERAVKKKFGVLYWNIKQKATELGVETEACYYTRGVYVSGKRVAE
eukprot:11424070-Prorocentrum_lima.AAC.1